MIKNLDRTADYCDLKNRLSHSGQEWLEQYCPTPDSVLLLKSAAGDWYYLAFLQYLMIPWGTFGLISCFPEGGYRQMGNQTMYYATLDLNMIVKTITLVQANEILERGYSAIEDLL